MRVNPDFYHFRKGIAVLAVIALTLSPMSAPAREGADAGKSKTTPKSIGSQNPAAPMMAMPLVAPVFLEDQEFSSTLVLVNASSENTYATVTVRSLDGRIIGEQKIPLAPSNQARLPISALLRQAGSRETRGSIIVEQSPDLMGMAVLAQLSITHQGSHVSYIDEELSMPDSTMGSTVLRGVGRGSEESTLLAISSLSHTQQEIRIDCISNQAEPISKTVELAPNATVITEVCSKSHPSLQSLANPDEEANSGEPKAVGIQLLSNTGPGQFAAFGITRRRAEEDSIFGAVAFTDPKLAVSSSTVFAGLPVGTADLLSPGTYKPYVAVANFALRPSHVKVSFSKTSGASGAATASNVVIREITLQSLRATSLPLSDLEGDSGLRNSFVVTSDAAPGDIGVSMASKALGGQGEVELLQKDEQQHENAGVHPWSVANGDDSILLLFNHTDREQRAMISVLNGKLLWQKLVNLAPFETIALSVSDLVKLQLPDDSGKTLPSNLTDGQISWTMGTPKTLTGRLLVSNRITALARSFSCGWYPTLCGATMNNASGTVPVGGSGTTFIANANICGGYNEYVCYGSGSASGITPQYSWYSGGAGDISVPTSCSGSAVCSPTGSSPGTDQINAQVTYYSCSFYPSATVHVIQANVASADITQDQIIVALSGDPSVSGSLRLQVTGANGHPPVDPINTGTSPLIQGTDKYSFQQDTIPIGEYTTVTAIWTVNGINAVSNLNYHFKVLGTWTQTSYNTPAESMCAGGAQPITVWDNQCHGTNTTVKSGFDFRVTDPATGTGSGHSDHWGDVQQEQFCSVGSGDLRGFATITGTLGGLGNNTVAACSTNTDVYQAGAQVYLRGIGVKTVTDRCNACCLDGTHLDNYTTDTRCSRVGSLPNALTVRLY